MDQGIRALEEAAELKEGIRVFTIKAIARTGVVGQLS